MNEPSNTRSRRLVSGVLVLGVLLAVGILAVGLVLRLTRGSGAVAYAAYHPQPESLRGVAGVFRGAKALDADAVLLLGVLALVVTPALRVLVAGLGFAAQRERAFTLIAALVLAGLALGASGVVG